MLPSWVELTVLPVVVTVIPDDALGEPSVTRPVPDISFGERVAVPLAGTTIVSGFRSHSSAGTFGVLPVRTSSVAEYAGNVMVPDHGCDGPATMLFGEFSDSV